jgi:hypothetical protein
LLVRGPYPRTVRERAGARRCRALATCAAAGRAAASRLFVYSFCGARGWARWRASSRMRRRAARGCDRPSARRPRGRGSRITPVT